MRNSTLIAKALNLLVVFCVFSNCLAVSSEDSLSIQRTSSCEGRRSKRCRRVQTPEDKLTSSTDEAHIVIDRLLVKKEKCKAHSVKFEVFADGCKSRTITNKYCYGQCNSFFIPSSSEIQPFASCSYCKPHKTTFKYVTLHCKDDNRRRKKIRKKVEIVQKCKCLDVDLTSILPTQT
ncbi:Oidioi.mRNA.OKI2018_I69.XSR.g16871.t1.cds [Oikopleura dioica]|uniref:Oidioi.mRNA.OKI2018_I69.XSR.g16871.t1.cds n=1 Tax=Oikopleura dioica TaxID=34765 RepID=A0ABN7SHG9_OIKDI|nr:Oidioi.mRNA.OKI2018_I69.XSR.g16871.t1.cds [Oikopleura dioica]